MSFRKETNKLREQKRKYFYWKNKLDTKYTNYTDMTEDEFKKFANASDSFYASLKLWEQTEEYSRLLYLLAEDRFNTDLYDVYIALKEEALKGNSTATKTMIDVQKEIKKRIKQFDVEEEDDGLNIDI